MPGKGKGPSKGKQPAKRPLSKRPAPVSSSSEDEGDLQGRQDILARLTALEQARGAGGSATGRAKRARSTLLASSATFQRDVLNRLSALESTGTPAAGERACEVTVTEATAVELSGVAEQSVQEESGQVAVAIQPPEGDGAAACYTRKRVLICGHSMVFWAARQAKKTQFGSQLGLSLWATVEWQGRRGLRWPGLLPLLFEGRCGPLPDILVIHLGGNDLGLVKGKALSLQAEADLWWIKERWPDTLIIWSAILPRRVWREALDPVGIERARHRANRALEKALGRGLGIYLPHPAIKAEVADLYRSDGVHLSVSGNDIFLEDLRQGLRLAISHLWGARA
ncbi:uncharacterized protein LOC129333070 [Eublepharis macularius]|uniref:Uncharacterized protein LOC129333070 n=1 Tax=Eublepharis macularius TaxID=481883 RepID=A0AA97JNK6_EUBMA|nr:uncharacterized protein LOC129333070 [Eublepharis macularius]